MFCTVPMILDLATSTHRTPAVRQSQNVSRPMSSEGGAPNRANRGYKFFLVLTFMPPFVELYLLNVMSLATEFGTRDIFVLRSQKFNFAGFIESILRTPSNLK